MYVLGRDDFFKTFRRTRFRVSVTKRNFPVCMEDFHHVSHTPHQYHPCDRIFGYMPKCDFSSFSLISLQQWLIYMLKSSSVTKRNIMVGMVSALVWLIPPASVGIVTENPYTGRKAQKCPNVKHSAKLVTPIFNPLHHTRDFFASTRGSNDYFGPKQPFWKN